MLPLLHTEVFQTCRHTWKRKNEVAGTPVMLCPGVPTRPMVRECFLERKQKDYILKWSESYYWLLSECRQLSQLWVETVSFVGCSAIQGRLMLLCGSCHRHLQCRCVCFINTGRLMNVFCVISQKGYDYSIEVSDLPRIVLTVDFILINYNWEQSSLINLYVDGLEEIRLIGFKSCECWHCFPLLHIHSRADPQL